MVDMFSLIKKLRTRTNAGIMECKNALLKANGDIDLAIVFMRESGHIKAEQKSYDITSNGLIFIDINKDYNRAVLLELNCQTDFVSQHQTFKNFGYKLVYFLMQNNINSVDILKKKFHEERTQLISQVDENITIKRFSIIEGENIGGYLHHARIGVVVSAKNLSSHLIKKISMHIAASKPQFLKKKYIPDEIITKEYKIQHAIALKTHTDVRIIEKIVEGRMKKFKNAISLENQNFIIDPNKTVGEILEEKHAKIIKFVRFEIGENI